MFEIGRLALDCPSPPLDSKNQARYKADIADIHGVNSRSSSLGEAESMPSYNPHGGQAGAPIIQGAYVVNEP